MTQQSPAKHPAEVGKLVLFAIAAGGIALAYWRFGASLRLDRLVEHEARLRRLSNEHELLVYAAAFAVYAVITGLSFPGALGLTLVYAWLFDFLPAVVLISFASTTGATFAFLLSRYLFRDSIERRFGERLGTFRRALDREGAFYLFALRLIPVFPFFVVNVLMGLTAIPTWTYWWVSQLGMLPGTSIYVYAGSTIPDLSTIAEVGTAGVLTPRLVGALAMLGAFPFVARWALSFFRPSTHLSE